MGHIIFTLMRRVNCVTYVVLLLAIVASIPLNTFATPQDYTQWRGATRDGSVAGFVEPASWPEALTRRWKIDVGEGYATPLVVGDAVYVFTRRDGNEVMTAVDANTGVVRWTTTYPAPYSASSPAAAHGAGPKATPLFHDGALYTLGISGIVTAFDVASHKIRWQVPAPGEAPFFGAASSPVGDGDLIIVHPGNYGPLTAFDAKTGAVKWTVGGDGFFASPIVATLSGVRQVITVTLDAVIGVSLPDGKLLWKQPWKAGGGGPTPVVFEDTVIVSALDAGTAAIKPVNRNGLWTVEAIWDTKDVSMYLSNPVVIGDALYGLSHRSSGQFFAIDARSGATLWRGQPREAANTAVAKAGDLLFLLNDDAELIVARGSRTGLAPLKRYPVADSATWAQPLISGNRVFIKDTTSLTLWTVN